MRALQEITGWNLPNHIYITDDSQSRVHAYVVDDKLTVFKKPLSFSTTRRKFQQVENIWLKSSNNQNSRTVTGSNGIVYTITTSDSGEQCTCPGFRFRGSCKHTK